MNDVIGCAVCFITALSSGLGAGGGGLLTMFLTSFANTAQINAQGINLLCFVSAQTPASVINMIRYKPDMRLIAFLTFCGAAGCVLGAVAASYADETVVRKAFGAFLTAVGVYTFSRTVKGR